MSLGDTSSHFSFIAVDAFHRIFPLLLISLMLVFVIVMFVILYNVCINLVKKLGTT
jgi:uncharacterized membrane protein